MTQFNGIEDVVEVAGDLYCKTPTSLAQLKEYLVVNGYDIEDCSKDKSEKRPSREVQEKNRWCLWFARLNKQTFERKGKCGSCSSLMPARALETHNHKCGACGVPTYVKFNRGGTVRFSIIEDRAWFNDLTLIIHSYDEATKTLNFYANLDNSGLKDWSDDVAASYGRLEAVIKQFPDALQKRKIGDVRVLSTHHDAQAFFLDPKVDKINPAEVRGETVNFEIVKLYKGREIRNCDALPVPETYGLYEAWHWAPLKPSQTLHEAILSAAKQTSDCGWFHQDGMPYFTQRHFDWMRAFVENFTTLDINAFDQMIAEAPLDGPGFIRTLAAFCHPNAKVQNKPNIGNTLGVLGKFMEGGQLTQEELDAGEAGLRSKDGIIVEQVVDHMVEEATTARPKVLSPKQKKKFEKELRNSLKNHK